jgi:eukaryotic-like serine/threonine-protein kinase
MRFEEAREVRVNTRRPARKGTFCRQAYLRGLSYLKEDRGDHAIAEFQKIIDHRGVVVNFHTAPVAQLGLARADAISGDREKARGFYEAFFTLWSCSDPDLPILKEAKIEYAALR